MRVAITGGTGFVGRHLADHLAQIGHEVILVARGNDTSDLEITARPNVEWVRTGVGDPAGLRAAFTGVDAVVHCAGINREIGQQTYQAVHVEGTRHVIDAARDTGVSKLVMLSFLRARPDCGSPYHESKWAAEEMVRESGISFTILKSGMIFGRGDHMLDHLSHALYTFPFFLRVGFHEKPVRPVSIHDVVHVLTASLTDPRLESTTVPVLGPEELMLSEAAQRVGDVIGRRRATFSAPIWFHRLLAFVAELTMRIPLASRAQVRMLAEGVTEPVLYDRALPDDLRPSTRFAPEVIKRELPAAGRFTARDLRCCLAR
ncbi:MAG: NAD(P)H-binding protein [Dehalococcoidia bacterium]